MSINFGQASPMVFRTKGGLFGFGSNTYNGGISGTKGAAIFDNRNNFLGVSDGLGNVIGDNGSFKMSDLAAGSQMELGNSMYSLGQGGVGTGGFSFGDIGSLLGAGAGLLQGLAGLRQAQMAEKALGLAENQFSFQKGLANRNLANQAKIINNQYDSAGQVAAGMMNGKDADGNYGYVDPATVKSYASYAKSKHVDGSPIS